jgi:hypothetical protein
VNQNTPKTFYELLEMVLPFLPEAMIGEDNEGQLVIYTGLYETDEMKLAEYSAE